MLYASGHSVVPLLSRWKHGEGATLWSGGPLTTQQLSRCCMSSAHEMHSKCRCLSVESSLCSIISTHSKSCCALKPFFSDDENPHSFFVPIWHSISLMSVFAVTYASVSDKCLNIPRCRFPPRSGWLMCLLHVCKTASPDCISYFRNAVWESASGYKWKV